LGVDLSAGLDGDVFHHVSGSGLDSVQTLLPGGGGDFYFIRHHFLLSVTVTFEKKSRSFERLLTGAHFLELLMLAKTAGAILFGIANAFVPVVRLRS
jgi:ABC-2 type transport system permease protein